MCAQRIPYESSTLFSLYPHSLSFHPSLTSPDALSITTHSSDFSCCIYHDAELEMQIPKFV